MRALKAAAALAVSALALTACNENEPRRGKAEVEQKSKPEEVAKEQAPLRLDSRWDDSSYLQFKDGGPCPEGLWALFSGEVPGSSDSEKAANKRDAPQLAKKFRDATFVAVMKGPAYVTLGEYQPAKGAVPIQVKSLVDCQDSIGRIAVAFTAAQAELPPGRSVGQYLWTAAPLSFDHPVKFSEWRKWQSQNRAALDARIVFKLGKVEVHKKLIRNQESAEEKAERKKFDIPGGGNQLEDWGAGRMAHAEVVRIRVATDASRTELVAKEGP